MPIFEYTNPYEFEAPNEQNWLFLAGSSLQWQLNFLAPFASIKLLVTTPRSLFLSHSQSIRNPLSIWGHGIITALFAVPPSKEGTLFVGNHAQPASYGERNERLNLTK